MEKRLRTLASIRAPHFSAHLDQVELVSGRISERIRIEHPVASAVLPLTDNNEIVMVRQYRYALGKDSLEIPAGKVDPGEDPLTCARRELLEETGFKVQKLTEIFEYYPAIGYSNEVIKLYLGKGLEWVTRDVDEDEITGVEIYPVDQVREMILDGRIRDSKTVLSVALLNRVEL